MKPEDKEDGKNRSAALKELAYEIRDAFDAVSPFIEKHTAIVCPKCRQVCCRDKHGRPDKDDLLFLRALGAEMPAGVPERGESDPCRFLTDTGCSLQRWRRPFRCTFFFCDPLLKSLEDDNAKLYRAFVQYFQHLVSVRRRLLGSQAVTDVDLARPYL